MFCLLNIFFFSGYQFKFILNCFFALRQLMLKLLDLLASVLSFRLEFLSAFMPFLFHFQKLFFFQSRCFLACFFDDEFFSSFSFFDLRFGDLVTHKICEHKADHEANDTESNDVYLIHDILNLYLSIHAEAYENGFDAIASLPIYFDSHC